MQLRTYAILWMVAGCPLLAGCGPALLTAEDVVVLPGQQAQLTAFIDSKYLKQSVVGANVTFQVNCKRVGQARTDEEGRAAVSAEIDEYATTYQARAVIDGRIVQGNGRIFHWDLSRTVVAVDVDDTISHTNYSDLFIAEYDATSPPLENAPQVLGELAHKFRILYVSARPRWLHDKTKVWLDDHNFPRGPILHAPGFEGCFRQTYYKKQLLSQFQSRYPNLLIGVGDNIKDDVAYGDHRMLAVILSPSKGSYRRHCVVMRNWDEVSHFVDKHTHLLADPKRFSRFIDENGSDLRTVLAGDNSRLGK